MIIKDISKFRKNFKSYLDKISNKDEVLIINRRDDSGVVLLSLKEYNSMMATNYELTSRNNEKRLDAAIEKLIYKL